MQERSLFEIHQENESDNKDASDAELIFLIQAVDENTLQFPFTHNDFWTFQSHRVSRQPNKLIFHLQRIYYCYSENMPEHLYAALVDLAIVLKGKKDGINKRLYLGTRKKLQDRHRAEFDRFYAQNNYSENDLPLNNYSVLGKGRISNKPLIVAETVNKQADQSHDPLMLARDYIEYSQLDEARVVLEQAVTDHPDNRDYHEELLGLYKSTRDKENYFKMYEQIKGQGNALITHWKQLLPLFSGS